ncbi:methylmalonyl Co-A mutase-associated GTPase MeaB [Veillonella agrestimuris]|uniref:methylmalonyl Co-A mutase-associated GTPase MeaB n=1 Tax=Veillonella agrestimuris TaxID=2941340 RepID=UPI002040400F|nr:methylmalonyl Co-A mutase-associated GTPase MeaB [Veillonella agrestimuris]
MTDTYRPDWVPNDAKETETFASRVMRGVDEMHDGLMTSTKHLAPSVLPVKRRKKLTVADYVRGIEQGDRVILSRAITLVESNNPDHFAIAQQVLQSVLSRTGNALRIGITGVPGAGKSSIIEAFGNMLIEAGLKVAVLAVDPTSQVTKGSILGDKTRMETLTKHPNAYIRPSPAGGTLGGVARKSRETMLLCEAAGYDVILVETVGVGQSEVTVRSMVDFFMLIVLTGAGDELQGIKKGVMELADAIVVNKADGDNLKRAQIARSDYNRMLHYIRPATEQWETKAYTCSAVTKSGLLELWELIQTFAVQGKENGVFYKRRQNQSLQWVRDMIDEHLHNLFFNNIVIQGRMGEVEEAVLAGNMSESQAVQELVSVFDQTLLK